METYLHRGREASCKPAGIEDVGHVLIEHAHPEVAEAPGVGAVGTAGQQLGLSVQLREKAHEELVAVLAEPVLPKARRPQQVGLCHLVVPHLGHGIARIQAQCE